MSPNPSHPHSPDLNLDDLRLFGRLARLGSLSAVARERNVPVSQISRMLKRIESAYGVRLVHRSTHGLSLTPEGERLHESAERVVLELEALGDELAAKQQAVSGLVRVAASANMAQWMIVPSLPALMARHPGLRIDLRVDDQVVDMVHEGVDIAIRTGAPGSDQWVMRPLGVLRRCLYASPAYLQQHGQPNTAAELAQHSQILHSTQPRLNRWSLNNGHQAHTVLAQGRLMTDNSATLVSMVLAGLGIGRLPSPVGQVLVAQGLLVEVMPAWSAHEDVAVSAAMQAQRHRLPKVRACVDHWVQWFAGLVDNQAHDSEAPRHH